MYHYLKWEILNSKNNSGDSKKSKTDKNFFANNNISNENPNSKEVTCLEVKPDLLSNANISIGSGNLNITTNNLNNDLLKKFEFRNSNKFSNNQNLKGFYWTSSSYYFLKMVVQMWAF